MGLTSLGLIQLEVEVLAQLALVGPAHRFLFPPFFRQLRPLGRALGRFGFASGFRRTFWGQGLSTTGSAPAPGTPFWGQPHLHPEAPAPPPPAPACPAAPSPSAPRRRRARGRKVWQSCFRLPASPRKDWAENGEKKGDLGFLITPQRSLGLYPSQNLLTLAAVGDKTFFFFLILMPGMGAELRASRKPSPSMAEKNKKKGGKN